MRLVFLYHRRGKSDSKPVLLGKKYTHNNTYAMRNREINSAPTIKNASIYPSQVVFGLRMSVDPIIYKTLRLPEWKAT
jgi:hypothetical protein